MPTPGSKVDDLLIANAKFAETYAGAPKMSQTKANTSDSVVVLTCMDGRVVPERFLGGAPFLTYRNAGGRCTADTIRSLAVLRTVKSKSERMDVMVIQHTDCGVTTITNEEIRANVKVHSVEGAKIAEQMDFSLYAEENLDKVLVDDVKALRSSEMLTGVHFRGFIFDVETGLVREVEV